MMKDSVLFGQMRAKWTLWVQTFPQATNRSKGTIMRRALYLGGIFLATGAAVAMAAPAQAADGKCRKDYVVAGYGYNNYSYAQPVAVVPVGYDYGYGYGDSYEVNSVKSISQNGLLNVGLIDSPIDIL
jgi:hypothetical protein